MNTTATPAALAFDMGATKIAFGVVPEPEPTNVLAPGQVPTQPDPERFGATQAREQLATAVRAALDAVPDGFQVTRAGLGAPGVIDHAGTVTYNGQTLPGWAGTDLAELIRDTAGTPVACANDVRCWAFGEQRLGAGRDPRLARGRVLYVSLGTGVGGAVVHDGELIDGPTGSAGEISELVCADFRGRADRAENIASGDSLARYYNTLTRDPEAAGIPWRTLGPGELALPEIIERMRAGDGLARRIVRGNLEGLGRTLGALVSALDLGGVVLGGGVTAIGREVTEPIAAGIHGACLAVNRDAPVLTSTLGGHAPLIAAACLARTRAR